MTARPLIDYRLAEWISSRDTGDSSMAVVCWLGAGVGGGSAPGDLQDVGRCIRLLDRIPEWRPRMPLMAGASTDWRAFADRWAELESALISESNGRIKTDPYGWGKDGDFSRSQAIMADIDAELRAARAHAARV